MVSFTNRGHINMQNAHFCYALVWNDCIHMSYVRLGHTVFAFTAEDQPYTLLSVSHATYSRLVHLNQPAAFVFLSEIRLCFKSHIES